MQFVHNRCATIKLGEDSETPSMKTKPQLGLARAAVLRGAALPRRGTYTLLSVRDRLSASLDRLCCSLSLALVAGARA